MIIAHTYILKTVLAVLLICILIHKNAMESLNKDETAKTVNDRAKYAKIMLSLMNQTVDPCDDFYEYACGNYRNVYEKRQPQQLPPGYLFDTEYIFNERVEELLQQTPQSMALQYAAELKVAKQFHSTCLAADLYPMKKSQTYLELLRSIGGFPAADTMWQDDKAEDFSWFNMSANLNRFGASSLIREYMGAGYPFPLFLTRPELGFEYKIKYKNSQVLNFSANAVNKRRMRELLLTYQSADANTTKIIVDILELWQAILSIEEPELESDEVQQDECQTELNAYYEIAWNGQNMNATDDDYCKYLKSLSAICEQRKEAAANYLSLQFLHLMYARLDDGKFQREMCLYKVRTGFPYLFDKLYLTQHYVGNIDNDVTTIITALRQSLEQLIKSADWIDENTRKVVLSKATTISLHFNHKDELDLKESLIRQMQSLDLVSDNFDQNNMKLMEFKNTMTRYYTQHREQLENTTTAFDALVAMVANAQYSQHDNSITLYPGLLTPPAYDQTWPYALKFAGFGTFMGHELMHPFDPYTVQMDYGGGNDTSWSDEDYREFKERVECYAAHYCGYVVPQINRTINGNATKDENIADSGGLRIALNAYRGYVKALSADAKISLPEDEQMPGLNLTSEQLFMLGFAQIWCAAYEEQHYWLWLENEHTINKFRVLGALTNFNEFAEVYNCPLGTRMNPTTEKCRIW